MDAAIRGFFEREEQEQEDVPSTEVGLTFLVLILVSVLLATCNDRQSPETTGDSLWPVYLGNVAHNARADRKFSVSEEVWQIRCDSISSEPAALFRGAVSDGSRIYVSMQCCAACLSVENNRVITRWIIRPLGEESLLALRASPCVSRGRVFFIEDGRFRHWVYCVDASEGTRKWKYDLQRWGSVAEGSPVVYDNTLYIQTDSALVALDCDTGILRWGTKVKGWWKTSPAIVPDTRTIVTGGGLKDGGSYEGLRLLDVDTGKEKGSISVSARFHTPVVDNGRVFLLGLEGHDTVPGARVVGICVDIGLGKCIWTTELPGTHTNISPLIGDQNVVFFTKDPATMFLVDKHTGQVVSKNELPNPKLFGTLWYSGGILLGNHLFSYLPEPRLVDTKTGKMTMSATRKIQTEWQRGWLVDFIVYGDTLVSVFDNYIIGLK